MKSVGVGFSLQVEVVQLILMELNGIGGLNGVQSKSLL